MAVAAAIQVQSHSGKTRDAPEGTQANGFVEVAKEVKIHHYGPCASLNQTQN
jgi:hypothetical protein